MVGTADGYSDLMVHITKVDLQLLVDALGTAIAEADGWHDENSGGPCPDLDAERALLKRFVDTAKT